MWIDEEGGGGRNATVTIRLHKKHMPRATDGGGGFWLPDRQYAAANIRPVGVYERFSRGI